MTTNQHEALSVATAVSLYLFNVGPDEIALKIYGHFQGECMDVMDLTSFFLVTNHYRAYWATELPAPTALVLIEHACDRYIDEARAHVSTNLKQQ